MQIKRREIIAHTLYERNLNVNLRLVSLLEYMIVVVEK